jgi:hypothetical protein
MASFLLALSVAFSAIAVVGLILGLTCFRPFFARITLRQLLLFVAGGQLLMCAIVWATVVPIVLKFPTPNASPQLRREQIAMEDVLVPAAHITSCFAAFAVILIVITIKNLPRGTRPK